VSWQGWRRLSSWVAIAAVPLILAGCWTHERTTPEMIQVAGDAWLIDYPGAWSYVPFDESTSFFTTIAYLSSERIDVATLCKHTPNSVECNFRGYDLHPGNVAIQISAWGVPMGDPIQFWDHPEEGQRIEVNGVATIFSRQASGAGREVMTWKIHRPDSLDNWLQLDADVMGPNEALVRRQVEAIVASFHWRPPERALNLDSAPRIGAAGLAALRLSEPDAYACFPPLGATASATVQTLASMHLSKPLAVTCSTRLAPTDLGVWRLDLTVAWPATPDHPPGTYIQTQWLLWNGDLSASGGSGDPVPYCCG
jgi:hypothetical protein